MPLTKVVLIIEYDGTNYHGFQLQAEEPTIQREMETALRKLTGENTRVIAASRTDAGVRARGQVVSFRTNSLLPPPTFVRGLNYYLPGDIAVKTAYKVRDSFDVRRHAVSREYNYCILNSATRSPLRAGCSYQVPATLDTGAMSEACQALMGEHDMVSFASGDITTRNTKRTVYQAAVARDGDSVVFTVVANSFLPHQVRNTIGALIKVGLGKMTVTEFNSIIEARQPGLAGPTAPARGLCLTRINYPRPSEEEIDGNV